jgi:hypothetical protein
MLTDKMILFWYHYTRTRHLCQEGKIKAFGAAIDRIAYMPYNEMLDFNTVWEDSGGYACWGTTVR